MFRKLLATPHDPTATVLRITLGVIFFAHGAQKMLGWFGGNGYEATIAGFTGHLGIPYPLAVLAILAEFLGGLGLIVGLLGRVAAFGIACVMIVAAAKVHAPYGLFINWSGTQAGQGIEFHLLALAMAVAIIIRGSGAWSIDHMLSRGTTISGTLPRQATARL
jgi:putative oxidoreductase